MFKKSLIIITIVLIAGTSGIIADRYLFPYLASTQFFSHYEFLQQANKDVTVINKTEKVYIKEASSVSAITDPVIASIVNIISYSNNTENSKQNSLVTNFKNGTGEILTSDGIIMTYVTAINSQDAHYKIITSTGDSYEGKLIGIDSWSNLAFLKIETTNLPVIPFSSVSEYQPGEKIITIGNNFSNYQNRFSVGILNSFDDTFNISGHIDSSEKMQGVFLTDINNQYLSPGDAVFDYSGQFMGIVGSKMVNNQNKFFIISSHKVENVLKKVISKTLDTNPVLGVYYKPLTESYGLVNKLKNKNGALIYAPSGKQGLAIIAGTPAAKSQLKINDIIEKVDDQKVDDQHNLSAILYNYKKGDEITLTVLRNQKEIKIKIQL